MRLLASLLLSVLLIGSACSRAGDETPTPAVSSTTSTALSDSTSTTTTTSATIRITGLPPDLLAAVQNVYDRAIGAGDPAALPQRLNTAVEAATTPASGTVRATATQGAVLGDTVAVVRAGPDVLLLVEADDTWQVVGFKLPSMEVPATYGPEIRMILVVGSDARPGEDAAGARADSLHVVAARPAEGTGAIVGIPRDSWVTAPSGRNRKFTNILAISGPDALLETARTTTGLELEGYLLTGFAGFVDLIDEFGTFEIDIPMNMADRASQAYFSAGLQEIDGSDALAFARNRTIAGGDFTRQLHGGVLISWIGRAVQDLGVEALPDMLELLTTHTVTDLSAAELLTLTASLYELDLEETPNVVVDGRIGTAGSASVVFLEDAATTVFEDLQDGQLEAPETDES